MDGYTLVNGYLREAGLKFAKAFILVIAGYVGGRIAGIIAKSLVKDVLGLDKWVEKRKLKRAIKVKLSMLAAELSKWFVYLSFWSSAAGVFGSNFIARALETIVTYYPKLVAGIALLLFGTVVAELIKREILEQSEEWAGIISGAIFLLFALSALQTFGVNIDPVLFVFEIAIASFFITLSIALGLGIGLALKDELRPIVRNFVRGWRKE